MKVLEIVNLNPNKFGSFEKYCLGNGAYLRHAGHQHFACFKGDACQVLQAELDNSGSIFLNKYFNNLGIISTLKLIKYLRRHDVDVVHFHFYPIFSFFTLVSRLLPCKVYFSYRISGDFSRNGFVVRLLKKIRSKVLGIGIDGVFCVSGFARDKFIHNYLADPEIAKVVHNGLNWNFFKLGKKDHGTDEENGLQIICVAALIKDKGIIDVIDAVRLVCEKIPAWQLTVVGDGEDRQELESLVKSSRLESNVSFLGSRDDVPELLNRSDVAVAPSRWGEAFGFTVIEAMAAGLPVIASSVGGIPEIIDHERTGLLVQKASPDEIADALLRLYGSSKLRADLGEQGALRVKEYFNVNRVYEQQLGYYLEL